MSESYSDAEIEKLKKQKSGPDGWFTTVQHLIVRIDKLKAINVISENQISNLSILGKRLEEENAKLKEEIENQKKYVQEEVESQIDEMGVHASDFDKDLWRELRPVLVNCGLDWKDHPDGINADDALEYVRQYFQAMKEENAKLKAELEELNQDFKISQSKRDAMRRENTK